MRNKIQILKFKGSIFIQIAAVLFFLNSCTKEVVIDIPGYQEQLVVDGQIETDQPPFVLLSRSKDIYAPTDFDSFLQGFVSGAVVTMSDGTNTFTLVEICTDNLPPGTEELAAAIFGVPASEIVNYHLCGYTTFDPLAFGQVGKTYTLSVTFEGKTYTSETSIVPPTPLNSVFWTEEPNKLNHGYSHAFLSDPAGGNDAYKWEVKRINLVDGKPKDAGFKATFNPVFNDDFIDGKTFDFFYENPMSFGDENVPAQYKGYYQLGDTVVIKFSKMDQPAFDVQMRKYLQLQSNGNPFASPTNIPTNISGGCLGSWIGYSTSFDTLICAP